MRSRLQDSAEFTRGSSYVDAVRGAHALTVGIAHPAFTTVGGAEVLLSRYASHLVETGHRVRLVTKQLDALTWNELASLVDARIVPNSWMDHLGVPGTHPEIMRRVLRHVAALGKVDVVIGGNFPGSVIAAAVPNVPSVWACMEPSRRLYPSQTLPTLTEQLRRTVPENDCALMRSMRDVIERDLVGGKMDVRAAQRRVDRQFVPAITRIAAISEFTAANVKRIYGRAVDAIVRPTVAQPARTARAPGISHDGLQVLVHGRMDLPKNVERVIRGFALFTQQRRGQHELHLVGTGPDLPRLQGIAKELELGARAQFHGFLHDERLRALYARCDVMASLPVDEPFGMVFPEAALRGLLLIGPDHGGPSEILDDGALGWCINAFSSEALAEALSQVWALSFTEAERRRERAASMCALRYSPESTLPAFEGEVLAAWAAR